MTASEAFAAYQSAEDLRKYWHVFTDADPVPTDFIERMENAGLARMRPVTPADIEDDPFAAERGIERGGYLWELTAKGHAALADEEPSS